MVTGFPPKPEVLTQPFASVMETIEYVVVALGEILNEPPFTTPVSVLLVLPSKYVIANGALPIEELKVIGALENWPLQ